MWATTREPMSSNKDPTAKNLKKKKKVGGAGREGEGGGNKERRRKNTIKKISKQNRLFKT